MDFCDLGVARPPGCLAPPNVGLFFKVGLFFCIILLCFEICFLFLGVLYAREKVKSWLPRRGSDFDVGLKP